MNAQNKVLTVTTLNEYIKTLFDREPFFQSLLIEGEISNYKRNVSGHLYFTLKDEESHISCVMFKSRAMSLTFEPSSGMKVLIKGTVSLYPKGGTYQIYVEDIKESGLGELYIKYEELKKKLFNKGQDSHILAVAVSHRAQHVAARIALSSSVEPHQQPDL